MIGFLCASAVAAAPPNACAILTQSEVAAALGVPVGTGERIVPDQTDFCTWREQGKNQTQAGFVAISFLLEQAYQMRKVMLKSNTPAGGIGDEAYFSKEKGMVPTLTVKKGGTYFEVTAQSRGASGGSKGDDLEQKDKEIDLAIARLILKKL
jgi:hypothetical protein